MFVKKTTVIAALIALAISSSLSALALTFEEVKATQCERIENILQDKYQNKDNIPSSEQFGIPAITFEEAKEIKMPLIIYTWARWCGPCMVNFKTIKDIGQEYGDRVILRANNVDRKDLDMPPFKDIPTALFYKDGILVTYSIANSKYVGVIKSILDILIKTPLLPQESGKEFANSNDIKKLSSLKDSNYKEELKDKDLSIIYAYWPNEEHKQLTSFIVNAAAKYHDVSFYKYNAEKNDYIFKYFSFKVLPKTSIIIMKGAEPVKIINDIPIMSFFVEYYARQGK